MRREVLSQNQVLASLHFSHTSPIRPPRSSKQLEPNWIVDPSSIKMTPRQRNLVFPPRLDDARFDEVSVSSIPSSIKVPPRGRLRSIRCSVPSPKGTPFPARSIGGR